MILKLCLIMFVSQLVFIGCRTWNVQAIAREDIGQTLLSGAIVHLTWLVSIAIGAMSMNEIISNFKLEYLPIVACSLSGGLIGSYYALKRKVKK